MYFNFVEERELNEIAKIQIMEDDKEEIKKTLKEFESKTASHIKTSSSTLERKVEQAAAGAKKDENSKKIRNFEDGCTTEEVLKRYNNWAKHPLPNEKNKLRYIPRESLVVETGVNDFLEKFKGKFPPHLKNLSKDVMQKEIKSILRRSKLGFSIVSKSCGSPKEYRFALQSKTSTVLSCYSGDRLTASEVLHSSILNLFD